MSIEDFDGQEIISDENMKKFMREEVKPFVQNYGSYDDLSASEIRSREAMVDYMKKEVKPFEQNYGSYDDLSASEIRSREAMVDYMKKEVRPIEQNYGSYDSLSDDAMIGQEAMVGFMRKEVRPVMQHYGSYENLSDLDSEIMEAQVATKRREDIPYRDVLNNLIVNPRIEDNQQFEDAVIRSMQSNGLMKSFTTKLVEEISTATYGFKGIDKTDLESVSKQKQKLESLVNVYVRYLYELRNHDWEFYGPGNDIGLKMIDGDMLEDLWQVEKNFDLTFEMPIPKNLGEDYGQAFERKGKMVPGIRLMYDELKNNKVNWHQVMIYRENELTPKQLFEKRKADLEQFEASRYAQMQREEVLDMEELNSSMTR